MARTTDYPRELAEHFGRNLRRARRRADYSQEELSQVCDMHRTAIGLLENGARLPRLDSIVKLASGVNVEPSVLIDGIAWHPGTPKRQGFYVAGVKVPGPAGTPG
jgi:transcriptional regulator with XRE-family HTH domain